MTDDSLDDAGAGTRTEDDLVEVLDPADAGAAGVDGTGPATDPTISRPDVSGLSYEEARDKLVETVSRLESGQADLEASVALWELGEALAAHCTAALDRAQARLDRARPDPGRA